MFLSNIIKKKQCLKQNKDTKLEFGCGRSRLKPGFVGVDIRKCRHVKYVCKAWEIVNFIEEGTVTEIYSRHFFEHLTFIQADLTLKAWKHILISKGYLQIIVPDIRYHITQFLNPNYLEPAEANTKWTVIEHAQAGFWGWQREGRTEIWDVHKSGYDFRCLKMKLQEHGFSDVRRVGDKPWNLNVVCRKT